MQYGDSLRQVLLRKINKAEHDVMQLKLDYCRFVFGISHRSRVSVDGKVYQVRHVDVDTMARIDGGEFSKPALSGTVLDGGETVIDLGNVWDLVL